MRGPGEPAGPLPPAGLPPRRPERRRRRSTYSAWALAGAVALVVALVAALVAYGAGGTPGARTAARCAHPRSAGCAPRARPVHAASPRRTTTTTTATTVPPTTTTTTTVPPTTTTTTTVPATTTTTTGPGTLPQTATLPSATTPQFHAEMADLWQGIVTGDVQTAMPAFFPLGAYVQLKTIAYPQDDWQARLVGDFTLDVAAAHALLGGGASSAQLVSVDVPSQYAHWVTPGVCYNGVGYYEVPNARVVYQVGGAIRSFGIASMISWRGVWYVVHLGAVLRTTPPQGVVDAPATGPGTPAYSSTC